MDHSHESHPRAGRGGLRPPGIQPTEGHRQFRIACPQPLVTATRHGHLSRSPAHKPPAHGRSTRPLAQSRPPTIRPPTGLLGQALGLTLQPGLQRGRVGECLLPDRDSLGAALLLDDLGDRSPTADRQRSPAHNRSPTVARHGRSRTADRRPSARPRTVRQQLSGHNRSPTITHPQPDHPGRRQPPMKTARPPPLASRSPGSLANNCLPSSHGRWTQPRSTHYQPLATRPRPLRPQPPPTTAHAKPPTHDCLP
jgi:hypothetical protein